tara:strand:+ start:234 stop:1550 length:1317 start_codon:yes stop_codon:yes gene_type:complete
MTFKDLEHFFSDFFYRISSFKKYLLLLISVFLFLLFYILFSNQISQIISPQMDNIDDLAKLKRFEILKKYFIERYQSPYTKRKYTIQNNDSIEKILNNYDVKYSEIKSIVNDLKKKKLSNIYSGRELEIVIKKNDNEKNNIINIIYPVSNTLIVEIRRSPKGFNIKKNIIKLNKKEVVIKNTIRSNLYSSAVQVGIEPNIIVEFARIFGFEIDFQRDIRKNDSFEIYYERFVNDKGVIKDTGKIIYASMNVNNQEINLYNFKYKDESGYYDLNGKSIIKALMKTPVNGARLSSSFGNRKHPILGFNKHHNGTDFAAPKGTPIMASGNGKVVRARWCGGGGNCIKIRHNSSYSTVYAHLSKFATREGRRVKQGQVIGYVGSTGMSTGPHLHYEVHFNGKPINSQKLKLPSGKILKGDERKEFEIERIKIDLKLSELRKS